MKNCPLMLGNPPETCRRCDKPLKRRKDGKPRKNAVWCSRECSEVVWGEHDWKAARRRAIERDGGVCVRRDQHEDPDAVGADMAHAVAEVGSDGDRWQERRALEREFQRRIGALHLEVNHIEPRNGAGYGWGCHHHVDGLETMCREHHVEETTRQRRGYPLWREDPRPLTEIEAERAEPEPQSAQTSLSLDNEEAA